MAFNSTLIQNNVNSVLISEKITSNKLLYITQEVDNSQKKPKNIEKEEKYKKVNTKKLKTSLDNTDWKELCEVTDVDIATDLFVNISVQEIK